MDWNPLYFLKLTTHISRCVVREQRPIADRVIDHWPIAHSRADFPHTVRFITDTLCGISPLPDPSPHCYNEFNPRGVMDHKRFDDLAEPWLRRLVDR